jgi:hypothetical protein
MLRAVRSARSGDICNESRRAFRIGEVLSAELILHIDSCRRDLDLATAALAELLGDRHGAAWFRKKAQA